MTKRQVLILIPARYQSSRFPGKPLAKILGKTMIEWVYQQCRENWNFQGPTTPEIQVYVVTDDQRIEDEVTAFGGQVLRVDDDVISGTERIALAFNRYFSHQNIDSIINVQGDEPLLSGRLLQALDEYASSHNCDIATMVRPRIDEEGFLDPNQVKVAFSSNSGQCHYFSRSSIPHVRNPEEKTRPWFHHIGVYLYSPESLEKFKNAPASFLEEQEKLEQLRALDLGMKIGAITIEDELIGVDTPEDIKKVEGALSDLSKAKGK